MSDSAVSHLSFGFVYFLGITTSSNPGEAADNKVDKKSKAGNDGEEAKYCSA